jgi:alpha-L-rhamnosidase
MDRNFLKSCLLIALFFCHMATWAQNKIVDQHERVTEYISPKRILWKAGDVKNEGRLLQEGVGQADVRNQNMCILENKQGVKASILLDFGKELQGGIQIATGIWGGNKPIKVRIRFGESASEAMSDIGGKGGATNDHAIRDQETLLPWLGIAEIGNTGYRFARIDLLDDNVKLILKEIRAISKYRNLEYKGSFNCSDTLLNKIWKTVLIPFSSICRTTCGTALNGIV